MADPVTVGSALAKLAGVRRVGQESLPALRARMPKLTGKLAKDYDMLAINPLEHALSHYPEGMRNDALSRAQLFQEVDQLQYLEDAPGAGRWFDQKGLTSYEMPLLAYGREEVRPNALGLYLQETGGGSPLPRASIHAGTYENPLMVLLEESQHAIDRRMGEKAAYRFNAPRSFLGLASQRGPANAQKELAYYAKPEEMRATLSQLLVDNANRTQGFVDTRRSAEQLLERARDAEGTYRGQATAEAILNDKKLRNVAIPYLLKALGIGGAMAGNELLEGDDGFALDVR
jgi:hypothetical protein